MSTTAAASRPTRPSLASFWHDLPREGRLLLLVVVLEFLGTGLVLPFNVVYLHEVRDFPLGQVGLLLGLTPLVGFLAVGRAGAVIDRYGARRSWSRPWPSTSWAMSCWRSRSQRPGGRARARPDRDRLRGLVPRLPEPDRRRHPDRAASPTG